MGGGSGRRNGREKAKENREKKTALDFKHGQPIWHVYSRRKKEGHEEKRKRIQLEDGITVSSGTKRGC